MHIASTGVAIKSSTQASGSFKIKASAKAFKILSSGLYSDKILAIVRELSTNAWDSHRKAGTTEPFQVHLPSSQEPWFSIEDFGTGLDDKDIDTIYTTYFESTKAETNDEAGFMGLGSKSPFSYTDSFTVTAVKNGVKRIYTMALDEHGAPVPFLMLTHDTDARNGVKVQIAVTSIYDFSRFIEAAVKTYRTFDIKPVILGVEDATASKIVAQQKYLIKTDLYGIREKGTVTGPRAIQGPVGYPISLPITIDGSEHYHRSLFEHIDLFFPIGKLDVTASREALSYDDMTTQNIKQHCIDIMDRLYTDVQDYISSSKDEFTAHLRVNDIKSYVDINKKHHMMYNGKLIDGTARWSRPMDGFNFLMHDIKKTRRTVRHQFYPIPNEGLYISDKLYFLNDLGKKGQTLYKQYVKHHSISESVLIDFREYYWQYLSQSDMNECGKWLESECSGLCLIRVSDLQKPVSTIKKQKSAHFYYAHTRSTWESYNRNTIIMKVAEKDIPKGIRYYVMKDDYIPQLVGKALTPGPCHITENVYFLRKSDYNRITKMNSGVWVNLLDGFKSLVTEKMKQEIIEYNTYHRNLSIMSNYGISPHHKNSGLLKRCNVDISGVKEVFLSRETKSIYEVRTYFHEDKVFYDSLKEVNDNDLIDLTAWADFRKSLSKYPMLKYIDGLLDPAKEADILNYISLIEETK